MDLPGHERGYDAVSLLREQLGALQRWHVHRRTTAEVVELRGMNRELRLDLERRQMVRARQQQALLARAAAQLEQGHRLLRVTPLRAVLVHRRPWVRQRVADELVRCGVQVVAQLDDGADAVGVSVAEQPDLLLVEDALPSMSGAEVVQSVREFCVRTRPAAHVEGEEQARRLVAAGAAAAFLRRTTPVELARGLLSLAPQQGSAG